MQLDTVSKTIKLEENIKLDTLVKKLSKLLPNGEWKTFTLETNTVINNWTSPIIIERFREKYEPLYPWDRLTYASNDAKTADYSLKSGIYSVDLKADLLK